MFPDDTPRTEQLEALQRLVRASESAVEVLLTRIAPALERIATALERPGTARPASDPRAEALQQVRDAIKAERWAEAEEHLEAFARSYPEAVELSGLSEELALGRNALIDRLEAQMLASREVQDADAVLACRDALIAHLTPERRATLDRELVPWLMSQLQRRMRSGMVTLSVVQLAGAIVERYGTTREGAGLRSSLPILRRCAGLCAQCGEPYVGLENACPSCQAAAAGSPATPVPPS